MAPADVLHQALAAAAAVLPTTTTPDTTTATTLEISTQTLAKTLTAVATVVATTTTKPGRHRSSTATATPTPSVTVSGTAYCWPGTCSPYMAVSFGPFPSTDNSRFISQWGGAAFAAAFGLLAIVHLIQGSYFRLWKVATAAMAGGFAAFAGYTLQAAGSRQDQNDDDDYHHTNSVQPYLLASAFVLLQIAPMCITLVPYITLNRLARTRFVPAHDSLPESMRRPWPSNARWVAGWPVWFILVAAGAAQAAAVAFLVYCGLTSNSIYDISQTLLVAADLVWAGGLAAQGLFLLILLAGVTHTYATLPPARPGGQQERSEEGTVRPSLPPKRRRQIVWLLGTTYGVVALIVMRVVYRTVVSVQASLGRSTASLQRSYPLSTLSKRTTASKTEVYAIVLDALPTCLALLLLCICHAGLALPATETRHAGSQSGVGGASSSRDGNGNEDEEEDLSGEMQDALHDLESPLGQRGVYFGQAHGEGGPGSGQAGAAGGGQLTAEQILLQQRAALQLYYRQRQRQQHRRQVQGTFRPGPRHPPPPVVEALARFSLSASLSVSLPRESFMGNERPAPGDLDEAAGGAPQRLLARLSMDNFILSRFFNAPSRSTSGRSARTERTGPPRSIAWSSAARSVRSAFSRAASQSRSHGSQSHSHSHEDDPFVGFDGVQAGLHRDEERLGYEDRPHEQNEKLKDGQDDEHDEHDEHEHEHKPFDDHDSRRTCDSPDEMEREKETQKGKDTQEEVDKDKNEKGNDKNDKNDKNDSSPTERS